MKSPKRALKSSIKNSQMLAEHAEFHVNINSVVGGGIAKPRATRYTVISKRALAPGLQLHPSASFTMASGQLKPLKPDPKRKIWDFEVRELRAPQLHPFQPVSGSDRQRRAQ